MLDSGDALCKTYSLCSGVSQEAIILVDPFLATNRSTEQTHRTAPHRTVLHCTAARAAAERTKAERHSGAICGFGTLLSIGSGVKATALDGGTGRARIEDKACHRCNGHTECRHTG